MKQLINFVFAIYLVIGGGIAMGAIGSVFGQGLELIHPVTGWLILILILVTLVSASLSGDVSKRFFTSACLAPLSGFMIVFMLGLLISDMLPHTNEGDSALITVFGTTFSPVLHVIPSVVLVMIFCVPLMVWISDRKGELSHSTPSGTGSNFVATQEQYQTKKLVPMIKEFLARPGNHVIFIGLERTGKSLAIESILPAESILSGKALCDQSEVCIDTAVATSFLTGLNGPVAFDEAQDISRLGLLLQALQFANATNLSYIVAAQELSAFSKDELDAMTDASATKIFRFERALPGRVDEIVWREITMYEAINFPCRYSVHELGANPSSQCA